MPATILIYETAIFLKLTTGTMDTGEAATAIRALEYSPLMHLSLAEPVRLFWRDHYRRPATHSEMPPAPYLRLLGSNLDQKSHWQEDRHGHKVTSRP
mmetsp:Transcript_12138/g.24746  ORF Transcript_12138/g.24746 Transcript_12138/m.24746 type:complete len:97 (+) Transcript_12138:1796-2086(+)